MTVEGSFPAVEVFDVGSSVHGIQDLEDIIPPHDEGGATYNVSVGKVLRLKSGHHVSAPFLVPPPPRTEEGAPHRV